MGHPVTARRRSLAAVIVVLAVVTATLAGGCSRGGGGSTERFCEQVERTPAVATVLEGLETTEPAVVEQRARQAAEAFRDLEKASPRDIRGDVARLSRVVERLLEVVEENPGDRQAVRRDVLAMKGEAAGAAAAALKVTAFARDRCGIDLTDLDGTSDTQTGDTSATDPPATGPTTSEP